MKTEFATLAGRIRQALLDLDHVVARAEHLYQQAMLCATFIHSIYGPPVFKS